MSPLQGLKMFSHAWNQIAAELLLSDPWKFEHGAPKGFQKAITDLETGAAFAVMATMAEESDGVLSRSVLWKEWAEAELATHAISLEKLKTIESLKQMEAYEKTEKRIKAEIDDFAKLFAHFGLFTGLAGNKYRIEAEGRKRLAQLAA
ncbi:hypothetical protein [Mesorhizobium sp. M6A.T.Ce.TU.016.01.1.1]|uniref:hypothetical protein n=1 Tax=Mesorhizobium sp. M6A.T.Ce.TU.016.01.1.1 TaxID=2496783 RepID=UPI000FC9A2BA|nr:hypothetical protein [Mesorhizobium sp. M6A.T.Ce.TU.016.01.1.1]RUU30393.1 hypothetical protein EOC94_10890 [Mesorhizobium sp. M6A.T.Ce.TU.016.01.1.1]